MDFFPCEMPKVATASSRALRLNDTQKRNRVLDDGDLEERTPTSEGQGRLDKDFRTRTRTVWTLDKERIAAQSQYIWSVAPVPCIGSLREEAV